MISKANEMSRPTVNELFNGQVYTMLSFLDKTVDFFFVKIVLIERYWFTVVLIFIV